MVWEVRGHWVEGWVEGRQEWWWVVVWDAGYKILRWGHRPRGWLMVVDSGMIGRGRKRG